MEQEIKDLVDEINILCYDTYHLNKQIDHEYEDMGLDHEKIDRLTEQLESVKKKIDDKSKLLRSKTKKLTDTKIQEIEKALYERRKKGHAFPEPHAAERVLQRWLEERRRRRLAHMDKDEIRQLVSDLRVNPEGRNVEYFEPYPVPGDAEEAANFYSFQGEINEISKMSDEELDETILNDLYRRFENQKDYEKEWKKCEKTSYIILGITLLVFLLWLFSLWFFHTLL